MSEKTGKLGIQEKLTLAVFLSVSLAALVIIAVLFLFSQKRVYRDTLRQSEGMVQAASLAFSQALAVEDEILLDALIHELKSRRELHIREAYVLKSDGLVAAHSDLKEYGKLYPMPSLIVQNQPPQLFETFAEGPEAFRVVSLLQSGGKPIGILAVSFSTDHLSRMMRIEMLWIAGATVPILIFSGLAVTIYGRRMVMRLKGLQQKVLRIGRGEWNEPLEVTGTDEIAQLTVAFNRMLSDLSGLREKDSESTRTIKTLNRDLNRQLEMVERLKERLIEENATLREELCSRLVPGEIIGSHGSLHHVMDQARQLASMPITVLVTGESGTGKELLAAFLHNAGSKRDKPFIKVNCAALPVTLIESELFGHEKGAFTGAVARKKGKFELAHGGTIFLDEVGELSPEAQAKLLRALQQGEISKLGSDFPISVDVRVITATNKDLFSEVSHGRFREDLYYRLKVVELRCPSLRERLEDIPVLAQHFIELYSRKLDKPVLGISPSALKALGSYGWPGNIRELENTVARAVALAKTSVLGPDDFTSLTRLDYSASAPLAESRSGGRETPPFESLLRILEISSPELKRDGWQKLLAAFERICLEAMLEKSKNQKEAAGAIGLTPTKLHRLIRKYGLGRHVQTVSDSENEILISKMK